MYVVLKNGKRNSNKLFATYEAARQAVRKTIRRRFQWRHLTPGNNPSYRVLGYTIRTV